MKLAIQQSIEYNKGYSDVYKDGYNKALEYLIEQEKYKSNSRVMVVIESQMRELEKDIV